MAAEPQGHPVGGIADLVTLPRPFTEGVTLRRGEPGDAEAMQAFVLDVFPDEEGGPDVPVSIWARDLLERPHPSFDCEMFALAVDDRSGEIIASTALIPQTWTYGGIPFGVGRPEIVGTRADWRRRGLAGGLMDLVHDWSARAGDLVQAITGIPWFYRRFGYEMALDLVNGHAVPLGGLPPAPEAEPCSMRPAGEKDVAFLTATYRSGTRRYLVVTDFDEEMWRLELGGRSAGGSQVRELWVVERDDEPVGMVVTAPEVWRGSLWVTAFELVPGVSWGEVTPSVLRRLGTMAAAKGAHQIRLASGDHPAAEVLPHLLQPVEGYAWYVRVPDVAGFVRHIAPVIEDRLAAGPFVAHSGEVRLSFYTSGIRIRLDGGRLAEVEPWEPEHLEDGDLLFPDLTFLRLLFGSSSVFELAASRADCRIQSRLAAPLVDAMFPKGPSSVLGVA